MKDESRQEGAEPAADASVDVDPVKRYYDDKKRRYLEDARRAAESMTTGTPFDWEDAERYGSEEEGAEER